MIQRLRHKFIATNMLLVSLILFAVFSIQTFSAYQHAREQVYQSQMMALRWITHKSPFGFEFRAPHRDNEAPPSNDEFPSVPIFAVEINKDGQIIRVQEGPGATVSEENAQALVDAALSRSGSRGTLSQQDLSYLYHAENDRRFFVFADNRIIAVTLRNQLLTSLLIGIFALTGFYFISRLLARLSLRPVERAWDQQRQFVADASHELKTPITVILANTNILLSHPDVPVKEQSKWIDYIQDEATRMKSLVDDLLFLAKCDASRLPTHVVLVPMDQLILGTLLSFEPVAFESKVDLHEEITPGLSVQGDEAQLRRLVVILLDNAVKYAGEQGSVTVRLDRYQEQVRLSVQNTGSVIPAEHLPHLFERFYRSDAARVRTCGGYGLGLSIAKSIVDGHRGTISVTSTEATGTIFTVLFSRK